MHASVKIALILVAAVGISGCNATNQTSAPSAAAPASKAASWDGEWTGAWGGTAATRVVVKGEAVVRYEYRGNSVPPGSTSISGDRLRFGSGSYSVSMTRNGPNAAAARWQSGSNSADAALTRR